MNQPDAPVADAAERALARDPARSVIVQAPAGSGKTELLMQRYLALLATVDEPEQILAVTFTRKAAAEMRQRILNALHPSDPAAQLPETAALARAVLRRDAEQGWRLLDYPARLRIRTFDSVNSWLADSAPLSSDSGAGGAVSEQVGELYDLAARRVLEYVTGDDALAGHLAVIMRHLDNQADRFIRLMAQMLERRDQWLPLLGSGQLGAEARALLEGSLQELVGRELAVAAALLTAEDRRELLALLRFAAEQQARLKPADPIVAWRDLQDFPTAEPGHIALWRALAGLLLVGAEARFRVKVNKSNGFPTPADGGDKGMTERANALLDVWRNNESLAVALDALRALPAPVYSDSQWEALEALIRVLPVVAAELSLVFSEQGATDYMQIAGDALQALHDGEAPTGLALRLDYRIQHILIDEFQDTSRSQFRLLGLLTEGWSGDDGRSLLVVGDPMQSIYRFRQAEVSLYMQLWEHGIGNLRLEQVQLTTNFRSAQPVVDWVNTTFRALMPAHSDPATGAVRFAEGTPRKLATADSFVRLHTFEAPARVDEAATVGALVEAVLQESATDTVGILVRTRNQARLIVPELRARGIPFSGAGLEQAGETAVEQDLIALTRALSHPGDRTAWLAVLRAPWCGLTLHDLEALCGDAHHRSVYEQMRDPALLTGLSDDGRERVVQLAADLEACFAQRGRFPLRDWIEGAWQRLGGPAALSGARDLELAAQFFATLDDVDTGGDIAEAFLLHEQLAAHDDRAAGDDARVHLLTLFKAKGLEYDVVILPALDGITRQDDKQAVAWHEYQGADSRPRYLLAPIEPVGDEADPVQKLIRRFDAEQAGNERDRLLYVAATRAKRRLHLCCEIKRDKDGEIKAPRAGSLLERVWPVLDPAGFELSGQPGTAEARETWVQPLIRRISSAYTDAPPAIAAATGAVAAESQAVTYEWAGSDAMRVGSVVHRCLEYIAASQDLSWCDEAAIGNMLIEEGVADTDLGTTTRRVVEALRLTTADEQGRWVLAAHAEAASELPVTWLKDGQPERLVIDRTFIAADGTRWIIDYKTSSHEGGDLEGFLANQLVRYAEQLQGYRAALQALEPERTIRTALYFPLLGEMREFAQA